MLCSVERFFYFSYKLKSLQKLPKNLSPSSSLLNLIPPSKFQLRCNERNFSKSYICERQFARFYERKCTHFVQGKCSIHNSSTKKISSKSLQGSKLINECVQGNSSSLAEYIKYNEQDLIGCENTLAPDLEEFYAAFHDIYKDLTYEEDHILSSVARRLGVVIKYNAMGGKKTRGMTVVSAYKKFSKKEMTAEGLKQAQVLGWCAELLQSFFLVSDDIMDNGMTRRGKACWFRLPEVGLEAVNDALLLECCIYELLKKYFQNNKSYCRLVDEFHKVTRSTVWGQCLDMTANPTGSKPRLDLFSPNFYWTIVEYKTTYYTFTLPINLAMHIIGTFSEEDYNFSNAICMKLGRLFQMQDDFLDIYGNPTHTGKIGSDIKQGKCSWLAVTALEICSKEGKEVMKENYGIDDPSAVTNILELYDSLLIEERFLIMERRLYNEISSLISASDANILDKDLFTSILENIHKRDK